MARSCAKGKDPVEKSEQWKETIAGVFSLIRQEMVGFQVEDVEAQGIHS